MKLFLNNDIHVPGPAPGPGPSEMEASLSAHKGLEDPGEDRALDNGHGSPPQKAFVYRQPGDLRHQNLMEMSRERRNSKHFTGKAVTKGAATWLYGPQNDLITKKLVNKSKSVFDYSIF